MQVWLDFSKQLENGIETNVPPSSIDFYAARLQPLFDHIKDEIFVGKGKILLYGQQEIPHAIAEVSGLQIKMQNILDKWFQNISDLPE